MVYSWNLGKISLAFCPNPNNFPRLKAREIIRIWTKRAWNYSLISLVAIWLHILISWFSGVDNYAPAMSKKCSDIFNAGHVREKVNFTITEQIFARWLVESYGLWEFSIITLMIIENRALWLASSFALSRYNHRAVIITLKANCFQNSSQIFLCFGVGNWSIILFSRIIVNAIILKQLVAEGDVIIGE